MSYWDDYEAGISLGDYDGEMRLHDDGEGNIFLLCWRAERESGEMRRDTEYDGSLGPPQAEALRKLLNERATRDTVVVGASVGTRVRVPGGWYGEDDNPIASDDREAVITEISSTVVGLRHVKSGKSSRNELVQSGTISDLLDSGVGVGEVLP